MENRKLSDSPKIIFVGFDDKPVDMSRTLTKQIKSQSATEIALSNYYKSLYHVGEAKQ